MLNQPPLISRDFNNLPNDPCGTTNPQLTAYQEMLNYHTITEKQHSDMVAAFDGKAITQALGYNNVMGIINPANCRSQYIEVTIPDDNTEIIIKVLEKQPYTISERAISNYSVSLFIGFDLLFKSNNNFDPNACIFEFIQGSCYYNIVSSEEVYDVVLITLKYDNRILGYFDISAPPPTPHQGH